MEGRRVEPNSLCTGASQEGRGEDMQTTVHKSLFVPSAFMKHQIMRAKKAESLKEQSRGGIIHKNARGYAMEGRKRRSGEITERQWPTGCAVPGSGPLPGACAPSPSGTGRTWSGGCGYRTRSSAGPSSDQSARPRCQRRAG